MNSLVVVKICFVLLHIFILVNLNTASSVLGPVGSSCKYSGSIDSGNNVCDKDEVEIKKLPKECTAFVFDGVICNTVYDIVYRWIPEDLVYLKSLIDFEDGKHSVYLFYKHPTLKDWSDALFIGDFQIEAQQIQDFTNNYAVKGLILDGMENPISSKKGNFNEKFPAYVKAIKTKNPHLEIGFYLSARTFINITIIDINSTWFNFSMMNDVMDFYVFEFATLNECSDQFLDGGVTPLYSTDPNVITLSKFATALNQSTIAKEKIYFEFLVSPIPKPSEVSNYEHCELSYSEYCSNYEFYKGIWCGDNQETLYEKGKFAKKYSKGFIGRDIDLVDRDNKCGCDNRYITFYMILNGYNDKTKPLACKSNT